MNICPDCRKQVNTELEYCNYCGAKLDKCPSDDTKAVRREQSGIKPIYILAVILVVLVAVFVYINGGLGIVDHFKGEKCITIVQTGSLSMYPDMEIGPAFDNFFGDPDWSYGVTTDGEDMVEFKGKCYVNKKETELTVQFIVDLKKETFNLDYVGIGRDGFTMAEIYGLLDNIKESCNTVGY